MEHSVVSPDSPPQMRRTGSGWNALRWNYIGNLVRSVSGLGIGILLAHLLGPKPFGIIAVGLLVVSVGNLLSDCGLSAVAIHRSELSTEETRFLFTVQVGMGILLSGGGWLCARPLAHLLRAPEATPVIAALSLTFVLQGAGQTAAALLRRDLRFAELQRIQIASYLVAFLVFGATLALLGFGVWSLVWAQLLQTSLSSALCYLRRPHPIQPMWSAAHVRMMGYGGKVLTSNLLSWSVSNLDNAGASRYFGVTDLGYYSRAFALGQAPANSMVSALQGVLFPIFSRNRHSKERLRELYFGVLQGILVIQLPLFAFCSLLAPQIIYVLYGAKWSPAASMFRPLALCMPINSALALSGPLLCGVGSVGADVRAQVGAFLAMVFAVLASVHLGVTALAWFMLPVYLIRFILLLVPVCQTVDLRMSSVGLLVLKLGLLSVVVSVPGLACNRFLTHRHVSPYLALSLASAVAALVWAVSIRMLPAKLLGALVHDRILKTAQTRWLLPRLRVEHPPDELEQTL